MKVPRPSPAIPLSKSRISYQTIFIIFSFIILAITSQTAYSQSSHKLFGKVVDENYTPLHDVIFRLSHIGNTPQSDSNGEFIKDLPLNVGPGTKIIITLVAPDTLVIYQPRFGICYLPKNPFENPIEIVLLSKNDTRLQEISELQRELFNSYLISALTYSAMGKASLSQQYYYKAIEKLIELNAPTLIDPHFFVISFQFGKNQFFHFAILSRLSTEEGYIVKIDFYRCNLWVGDTPPPFPLAETLHFDLDVPDLYHASTFGIGKPSDYEDLIKSKMKEAYGMQTDVIVRQLP